MTGVLHPRDFGAYPGADAVANSAGLNACFAAACNDGADVTIQLEPGSYWLADTIGLDLTADTSARIHLRGHGRRATWLYAATAGMTVMRLRTTTGNLRDIVVDDVSIWGGAVGVELSKVAYTLWRNVCWRAQTSVSLLSRDNSNRNNFAHCWWVHLKANAVMMTSGNLDLDQPLIGEDAGGIYVTSGSLRINGGRIAQAAWRGDEDPAGIVSHWGGRRAPLNLGSTGDLHLFGTDVVAGGSVENGIDVLHANNPAAISAVGCRLIAGAGGDVLSFRSAFNASVQVAGCRTSGNLASVVSGPLPTIHTGNV